MPILLHSDRAASLFLPKRRPDLPPPQLVIVNISDHYNRVRLSLPSGTEAYPDGVARVIGCLLGTQTGRTVEVVNSFEMVKGGAGIDQEHLKLRKDQYKEVFPALELIGWYATGTKASCTTTAVAFWSRREHVLTRGDADDRFRRVRRCMRGTWRCIAW